MSKNKVSPHGYHGDGGRGGGGVCSMMGCGGSRDEEDRSQPIGPMSLKYLAEGTEAQDTLHTDAMEPYGCTDNHCTGSMLNPRLTDFEGRKLGEPRPKNVVLRHAKDFMRQYFESIEKLDSPDFDRRLGEVKASIDKTGSYDLTPDELSFGVKQAWRNAPRCIGRITWSKLKLIDARHCRTASDMFDVLCNHMTYATNGGKIRSTITIFPPRTDGKHDYRVWNTQFIMYAGYQQGDGSVIGDPANVRFTKLVTKMGWKGEGTQFDVLPLLLQADGRTPEWFEIPRELILEVTLKHPKFDWFEELGYKWYALPAVANMLLDCGGLEFTGAPFNGWYMGSEIGARDLCDSFRYNITKVVAEKMDMDVTNNTSLWKDAAMVEVNIAVLHSYQTAGVTIVDHHSASESFMKHMETETKLRGGCPADWVWIVPPISGSLCPVFHQEMLNYKLKPAYEYQEPPWENEIFAAITKGQKKEEKDTKLIEMARHLKVSVKVLEVVKEKKKPCLILFATETGRSETFARNLAGTLGFGFQVEIKAMNEYEAMDLENESLLLVVASTFGNGDPPDNGVKFAQTLNRMAGGNDALIKMGSQLSLSFVKDCPSANHRSANILKNLRYSVFALGSRAYPSFASFGKYMDRRLGELGAERIHPLGEGDELKNQDESFSQWTKGVFQITMKNACEEVIHNNPQLAKDEDERSEHSMASGLSFTEVWNPHDWRLVSSNQKAPQTHIQALSMIHNQNIQKLEFISNSQLQNPKSDRETLLVRLSTKSAGPIKYEPGDHVAVYPCNRADIVDAVLERLSGSTKPDVPVQLELRENGRWKPNYRLPAVSIEDALTRYLDITTPPSQTFLAQLANLSSDNEERETLKLLSKDSSAYEDWKYEYNAALPEVFRQFPSVAVPPTLLLSQLPRLQPRWYSVSSTPVVHKNEIHLTVLVVNYKTTSSSGEKVTNHGVCSSWLSQLEPGDEVPVIIRGAPRFRMPEDKTVPVILVGPGTGIAPYRSFWHQRHADKKKGGKASVGRMVLYFGCRKLELDNLYREERDQMEAEGVITTQRVAISREPGKPKYVQHLMQSFSEEVFDLLTDEGGHLYICGDVTMASDVTRAVQQIIKSEGQITDDEAAAYIAQMKRENRFHEDIFGASLKKTVLKRTLSKK